jgi:hypothetical protein
MTTEMMEILSVDLSRPGYIATPVQSRQVEQGAYYPLAILHDRHALDPYYSEAFHQNQPVKKNICCRRLGKYSFVTAWKGWRAGKGHGVALVQNGGQEKVAFRLAFPLRRTLIALLDLGSRNSLPAALKEEAIEGAAGNPARGVG